LYFVLGEHLKGKIIEVERRKKIMKADKQRDNTMPMKRGAKTYPGVWDVPCRGAAINGRRL
jgi:hypothetical protein